MQKRVFRQNLTKSSIILAAGLIGLFFLLKMLIFDFEGLSAEGKSGAEIFIIVGEVPGAALAAMLAVWLLMKKHAVAIDQIGCELIISRPLGQRQTEYFEWKNVTSTNVVSETSEGDGGTTEKHIFKVSIKGKSFDLMKRGRFFRRDLVKLMTIVNSVTPHLPYIWKECSANKTGRVRETVKPFCRISRS